MKKVLLIFFCLILFGLPVFAEYKPIPKELSKQYKNEITKAINKKYNFTLRKINKISKNAEKMYFKVLKNKNLYPEFCSNQFEMQIDSPMFYLLSDLITITNKYTIFAEEDIPATDFSGTLYEFLLPYFIDNEIDMDKINNIRELSAEKYKIIEEYYIKSHYFIYPNEN